MNATTSIFDLLARDVKRELADNPADTISSLIFSCARAKSHGIQLEQIESKVRMVFATVAALRVEGEIVLESKVPLLVDLCDEHPEHVVDLLCLALSMVCLDFNQYTSVFSKIIVIDRQTAKKELNHAEA